MGIDILYPLMGANYMGVLIMSLENELNNLIDKYQGYADNYHRHAETYYNSGHFDKSIEIDGKAHPFELVAQELRLVLKNV